MERRFRVRLGERLADAAVPPGLLRGALPRLQAFLRPFVAALPSPPQLTHARHYVPGLLSDLGSKDVESIAYLHDRGRQGLQKFTGQADWDHQPLLTELARQVGQELGEPDGVLVFDPSAFPKKGTESVGVQRQWCGRLGKIDNCPVGLYLAYASRREHALVDVRLDPPQEWARRKRRRRKAGVPDAVRFRTRHELFLEMRDDRGPSLPHAWVAGDDGLGRCAWSGQQLRSRGECYLLAVPSNTAARDLTAPDPPYSGRGRRPGAPFTRVDRRCAALPEAAWQAFEVRDGEKGPLVVQVARALVQARTEGRVSDVAELLLAVRERQADGSWKHGYLLSDAALAELARVLKARHRIEGCLKRAKGEAGLAGYQVRSWEGWHHHQALALLATWLLTQETRRGKKVGPGVDDAAGAGADRRGAEPDPGLPAAGAAAPHGEPPFGAERSGTTLSRAAAQPLATSTL